MGGIKYDKDKPRMDLLDYQQLFGIAEVLTYGAEKYSPYNWKGLKASRIFAALQRHLAAFWSGEDRDPETGLSHLHHAAANLMMLNGVIRDNPEDLDDRYFAEKISEPIPETTRFIDIDEWIRTVEQRKSKKRKKK